MNAVTREAAAGHRRRTRTEVVRDVVRACRRLGDIATVAELGLREPSAAEVDNIAAGLHRALIELRAADAEGGDR